MDILEANPPVESLPEDYSYMGNGFKAQESRRILQVYSLIRIDRKQRQVKIHRLVQENAMIHLSKDQAAKAFITAAKLLHRAFPSLRLLKSHDIMTQRDICSKYCEHILAMLKCFDDLHVDIEPFRELTELIEIVFWYCRSNGLYRTAIPLYDTCAAIYQRGGDGCLYHACQLRFNVGHMYRNSDNAIEALRIFQEAYCLLQRAVELKRIPPEHPDIANALTDIGVALVQLQRYQEAEEWQDKGIAMSLRIKPDQLPSMLCVNKSWCLWKLGRLDEASGLLERVQQNCRLGHRINSHLRRVYSFSLRVLGNVRIAQGKLDEAFAIHEEAFDVHRQLFGDKHFETGILSYRLGCHLQDRNRMDEALVYYRAALTIFQNSSVSMTSSIIRTKYKLGCLLQQLGQEEASKLRIQAAKEREALHKIPSTEQDNMEAYDSLVPYWAW
ncbi:hypothetical protein BDV41DRAFT_299230 [Aspergillus transmontanensis]|uniref:DUF7779 domain-containing protein n=1 Tax=Aspergillus transmontanensis TaxID=1034304 RepID=A0A5N6VW01_9EURO|nr:hypothetical protein BDV41DRAFT_299230 [Aspergillus transmontanensis]